MNATLLFPAEEVQLPALSAVWLAQAVLKYPDSTENAKRIAVQLLDTVRQKGGDSGPVQTSEVLSVLQSVQQTAEWEKDPNYLPVAVERFHLRTLLNAVRKTPAESIDDILAFSELFAIDQQGVLDVSQTLLLGMAGIVRDQSTNVDSLQGKLGPEIPQEYLASLERAIKTTNTVLRALSLDLPEGTLSIPLVIFAELVRYLKQLVRMSHFKPTPIEISIMDGVVEIGEKFMNDIQ